MFRHAASVLVILVLSLVLSLPATAAEWVEVKRLDISRNQGNSATGHQDGWTIIIAPEGDRFPVHLSRIWVPKSPFDNARVILETADGKRHEGTLTNMSGGGTAGDATLRSWLFINPEGCGREEIRAVIIEQLTVEGIAMAEARYKAHEAKVDQAQGDCPLPVPVAGKPYPFTLTDLDGKRLDSEALKGTVVVLDFWATWCGPCRAEFPAMKALHQKHHGDGLRIIGISFDDDPEMTRATVKKHGLPWPQVLVGDKIARQALGKQTGVTAIPQYFVIDREGNLQTDQGRGRLEELLPELLE